MTITVEAVHENGLLKPVQPLPLKDREKVSLTVRTETSMTEQTYGMTGWTGSAESADYFAMDPELEYPSKGKE